MPLPQRQCHPSVVTKSHTSKLYRHTKRNQN